AAFARAVAAPAGSPEVPDAESAVALAVRGWLDCLGPVSAEDLAARLGLARLDVEAALARLEGEGIALRGRYTRGAAGEEWCERRLLARIHRSTLGRLRQEIDPVSVADFMRFLLRWQHAAPGTRLHGRDGLAAVVAQLEGLELPAPAWERSVLPLRVERYSPALLDELCFSGVVAWGRLSPPNAARAAIALPDGTAAGAVGSMPPRAARRRRTAPTRNAPLALALRDDLPLLTATAGTLPKSAPGFRLSRAARDVAAVLERDGASFLIDVARATGLLPTAAEEALWELVAYGVVTGDGFGGLRLLLAPEEKKRSERRLRAVPGGRARPRALPTGRWSLLRRAGVAGDATAMAAARGAASPRAALVRDARDPAPETVDAMARLLLRRWGVVLRDVLAREPLAPPWRLLAGALRRMEARGEIRGGRFIAGALGEQFALPEAVEALRATRRQADDGEPVLVSAADPLNLIGIVTPGARVSPLSGQVIALAAGVPVEVGELGAVKSRLQRHASPA